MISNFEIGEAGWENEGNILEFRLGTTRGLILRNQMFGTLNGYLGVKDPSLRELLLEQQIHGDWTYDSRFKPQTGEEDGLFWIGFDCGHCTDLFALPAANFQREMLARLEEEDPEAAKQMAKMTEAMFTSVNLMEGPFGGEKTYKTMAFVREELTRAHEAAMAILKDGWKGISGEHLQKAPSTSGDDDLEP